jgi:AraC-like DNA-binding protein
MTCPYRERDLAVRAEWPAAPRFVAALLPEDACAAIRHALPEAQVLVAWSWEELTRVVESCRVASIVIDPLISGGEDLAPAISLLRRFPTVTTLAYVSLSPQNFRAIARLGRMGLYEAFLHPLPDAGRRLRTLHDQLASETLVANFLGTLGPAAGRLPPNVVRAVTDLFWRPHRYKTAADLAAQSDVIPRHLYRDFESVRLGSPRKLVIAAKVLRAYGYLRLPHLSVEAVSEKLGYETVRILARHTDEIFGCCPSTLRKECDGEEVVRHLLEWFYKPAMRPDRRRSPLLRRQALQYRGSARPDRRGQPASV